MGMSSTEWSAYMHDELELAQAPEVINAEVVRRMLVRYATGSADDPRRESRRSGRSTLPGSRSPSPRPRTAS